MAKRSSIKASEEELKAYFADLAAQNVWPLWTLNQSKEPKSKALPYIWHWRDLRPLAMRAAELVGTKEAERRALVLSNPGTQWGAANTLFANMYLAYETLSAGMRRMLDGLVGVNSSAAADVSRTREDRIKDSARTDAKKEYQAAHPVVRVHPETGRRALYVNTAHTVRFEGMTDEESAPLLRFLYQHQVRPEFTCRFAWRPGSIPRGGAPSRSWSPGCTNRA